MTVPVRVASTACMRAVATSELDDMGFGYLKELDYECFLQDLRDQYGAIQFF